MAKPDLTYSAPDGFWTRFYPETPAGESAWRTMAEASPDGVVAFLPHHVPAVIRQLRAAGFIVHKARPHKPLSDADLDAMLSELES